MPDFAQHGAITTLHDLGSHSLERVEAVLAEEAKSTGLALVLPVIPSDMRAEAFGTIVEKLTGTPYLRRILVAFGGTDNADDYRELLTKIAPLGANADALWMGGPKVQAVYQELNDSGLNVGKDGKGRSVWTAFGALLSDPECDAFVLHDCDIVDYDRFLLTRLCLPMVHRSLNFEFCKAYYARVTQRLHGRVVRLLVSPLVQALSAVFPDQNFLRFLAEFRYPLSGEFAMTRSLAKANRFPSDWGLEVGTLAEVYRNTAPKRVCQVDLCRFYEHKHQQTPSLQKMAKEICQSLFRSLTSMGVVLGPDVVQTVRSAYLRRAQDAIRQYGADATVNGLEYNRHSEEQLIDEFDAAVGLAGDEFSTIPSQTAEIPNWQRVLSCLPDLSSRLLDIARQDRDEYGGA